jgi:hypothetical protein
MQLGWNRPRASLSRPQLNSVVIAVHHAVATRARDRSEQVALAEHRTVPDQLALIAAQRRGESVGEPG